MTFYEIINKVRGSTLIINLTLVRDNVFGSSQKRPVDISDFEIVFTLKSEIISYDGNESEVIQYKSSANPQNILIQKDDIFISIDTDFLKYDLYNCIIELNGTSIRLPLLQFQVAFSSTLASTTQSLMINNFKINLTEQDYFILSLNS